MTKRIWLPIVYLTSFAIFFILFLIAAKTIVLNSDSANAILQAHAIVNGNPRLTGWWLSNVSFYTTDLWLYALAILVVGFHVSLLNIVPAFIYTIVVMTCLALAAYGKEHIWWRRWGILMLVALPTSFMVSEGLRPMNHLGTLMMVLLAVLSITLLGKRKSIACLLVFIFLAMACFGDTLALVIGVIPIALALFIKREWGVAIVAILAAIVSRLILANFHGFYYYPLYCIFAHFDDLAKNISITIQSILYLTGADFFGHELSFHSLLAACHLAGTSAIVIALYLSARKWRSLDVVSLSLLLGMITGLGAFLISNRPHDIGSARYLTAFIFFGAILAAREFDSIAHSIPTRHMWAIVCLSSVIYLTSFISLLLNARTVNPHNAAHAQFVAFLRKHDLTSGYGSYWHASIATAYSKGAIRVRPIADNKNNITIYRWEANKRWYTEYANFLVFDANSGIKTSDVLNTFGKPAMTYHKKAYTVMVWNKNIAQLLHP